MDSFIDYSFHKIFALSRQAVELIDGLESNGVLQSLREEARNEGDKDDSYEDDEVFGNFRERSHESNPAKETKLKDRAKTKEMDQMHSIRTELMMQLTVLDSLIPDTYMKALKIIQGHESLVGRWKKRLSEESATGVNQARIGRTERFLSSDNLPRNKIYITKRQDTGALGGACYFTNYTGFWSDVTNNFGSGSPNEMVYDFWSVRSAIQWKSRHRSHTRGAEDFGDEEAQANSEFDAWDAGDEKEDGEDSTSALVNLRKWHCTCAEYALSKYKSRPVFGLHDQSPSHEQSQASEYTQPSQSSGEASGGKSGWGQGYQGGLNKSGQTPYCCHLVGAFIFTRGYDLFRWEKKTGETDEPDDAAGSVRFEKDDEASSGLVDVYEQSPLENMSQLVKLVYEHRLQQASSRCM